MALRWSKSLNYIYIRAVDAIRHQLLYDRVFASRLQLSDATTAQVTSLTPRPSGGGCRDIVAGAAGSSEDLQVE